jgi:hypothetical protein
VSKAGRDSLFTVAYVMVGLIATFIIGYLAYGHRFFQVTRPDGYPGQMPLFLIVGLIGALTYAAVQMRGTGLALLMIVLLYLLEVAMVPPKGRVAALGSMAILAIPVGFALLLGSYAQKALGRRFKFGRFVVMGAIVAVGYGLMMVLFLVRSHTDIQFSWVRAQALIGLELGLAMGLGFELVDLIGPRLEHRPGKSAPGS